MNDRTMNHLIPILKQLRKVTAECRDDMHEPDEQDVYCSGVLGNHLDNAMGADPKDNNGEMTVGLTVKGKTTWFNLSDLIALARSSILLTH